PRPGGERPARPFAAAGRTAGLLRRGLVRLLRAGRGSGQGGPGAAGAVSLAGRVPGKTGPKGGGRRRLAGSRSPFPGTTGRLRGGRAPSGAKLRSPGGSHLGARLPETLCGGPGGRAAADQVARR